jgi:1-acyl-sn-glycerol-3-phosphate acyltransferase
MLLSLLRSALLLFATVFFSSLTILLSPVNRGGKAFHWCARLWARSLLKIGSIRVRVKGIEHVSPDTTFIYAANHASYFDIPILIVSLPGQIRIVYKRELIRLPIFGWAMKLGSYVPIDRGDSREALESLERAAQKIREGSSVLLFPEGTRSVDGKLQPFKRGAFALAVRSRVPIVPVTINGSFSILPKKEWRVRPGEIEVVIHPPLTTNGWNGREGELQLMAHVRNAISSSYVEPSRAQLN